MTAEQWLNNHTFQCPHLRARITPAQCKTNRKRTSLNTFFTGAATYPKPPACEVCKDWRKIAKVDNG